MRERPADRRGRIRRPDRPAHEAGGLRQFRGVRAGAARHPAEDPRRHGRRALADLLRQEAVRDAGANVSNMRARDVQKSTGQKRSIHERLEEKKQIVEQQTKRKQRSGMEL